MKSATDFHAGQATALRVVTRAFGVAWLVNAAFQAEAWLAVPSAKANFLGALTKPIAQVPNGVQPLLLAVLHGVKTVGPGIVAGSMVATAVLIGLALLTRTMVAFASGFGIFYSLICWVVLDGFGFPYSNGQTDPGVFVAYAIAFLFVLAVAPIVRGRDDVGHPGGALWNFARIGFAALWLFDAALKWLPAFLFHFTSQITSVIAGQPHWVAVWLGFVAEVIAVIGPVVVAVLVGVAETAIGLSLLTGRSLRIVLPFGVVYSLAVWSTAEAFGGPYTTAGTGVRGNVLGNVLIYLIPLLFLWVRQRAQLREQGSNGRG